MWVYQDVEPRLFHALPVSFFINLLCALINNVAGINVNVCDEKCITS